MRILVGFKKLLFYRAVFLYKHIVTHIRWLR